MRESKLITLLKKIDEKERRNFEKFIQSPYFNSNKSVSQFWKCLKKHAPNYDSPKLERSKIYKKLFPGEVYDDNRLRQLRSLLLKLLQQFLVIERLHMDKQESDVILAKVYQTKQLFPQLLKMINTNLSSSHKEQKLEHFYQKAFWNKLKYQIEKESKLIGDATAIKKTDETLDLYYIGEKLKHACELVSWNNIMKTSYTIFLEEVIIEKSQNTLDLPVFHQLYAAALIMIRKPTNDNFSSFKKLYYTMGFQLEKYDRVVLLTYLLNFTFLKIQQHKEEYIREAFNLYSFGIDNELFILNNVFFADHFTNLISIASALRELKWIDDFLKGLDKQIQLGRLQLNPSYLNLSKGRVAFEKGDYQLSLEHLEEVNLKNQLHSFANRYISIACYVELQYPMPFIEAKCESFVVFVNRRFFNKLEMIEGSKNFVRVVKELIKEVPCKEKLLPLLKTNVKFIFKKWLVKRVDDL